MKLLSLNNVSVSYTAGQDVLSGVCLDIFHDDFIGVIGPNGGGKTTLIKVILQAVPYSGSVEFSQSIYRNKIRSIGYLPQQNLFDRMFPISVAEVVLSGLQPEKNIWSGYNKKDKIKADNLMQITGIGQIAKSPIGEISGGQLQRALLCRALISDPKLLILDEPANYVDSKFEGELYRLLESFNRSMAIIMVSHDLGTISSVVKNIVCVNKTVHRHGSNKITAEQLRNYDCPMQLVSHGRVPHTVLQRHD